MADQETPKKKRVGSKRGTVSEFIKLHGGVADLDHKACIKKFGKEERSFNKWAEELKKLTVIKTVNSKLLSSEV